MTVDVDYREWSPPPRLREHVQCVWVSLPGERESVAGGAVLPDGCMDIIWDGSRLFVAGPDTGPVAVEHRRNGFFAGVRFRAGAAPAFLGVPASSLRDDRVDLEDLWGTGGGRLADAAAAGQSPEAVAWTIARDVAARSPDAGPPDPLVRVLATLRSPRRGSPRVGDLAAQLGITERHLRRRCRTSVGYGPKLLHRVLRFRSFLAAAESEPEPDLARLAVRCGYADQAHLTRECRDLAGRPPVSLLAARRGVSETFKTRRSSTAEHLRDRGRARRGPTT